MLGAIGAGKAFVCLHQNMRPRQVSDILEATGAAGALVDAALIRLELDGDRITHEERLLTGLRARIRDVEQGPDGFIYVLTDADDGRLLRVGLRAGG